MKASVTPKSEPRLKASPKVTAPEVEPKPSPIERLNEYASYQCDHLYMSAIESINKLSSLFQEVLHKANNGTQLSDYQRGYFAQQAATEASEAIGLMFTMREADEAMSDLLRDVAKDLKAAQ